MTLAADSLLDRIKLKKSVFLWRTLAILAATSILITLSFKNNSGLNAPVDHIARIAVEGVIFENNDRDKILKTVKNDNHVKAVIVYINSPGGTIVGSENLYSSLREISKVKPVVAVMGSLAASGGYMTAIGADRIFARAGTITGSIGVLMQSFDLTGLGNKLGINFIALKSGRLKATPSPFEKSDPEAIKVLNESIADSFDLFLSMVVERRALSKNEINKISDGRILTGRQALEVRLIDELGGEDEAVVWLQKEKKINMNLKVIDVELDSEKKFIEKLMSKVSGGIVPFAGIRNGGLMAISSW